MIGHHVYSIVIPIYNEEENLPELQARLIAATAHLDQPFEVILVDDGSKDRSFELMSRIHQQDSRFKIVRLSRNFGHQVAISAGMDSVSGDATLIMDGDLQDPPELIASLVAKWKEGFEVVYAIRTKRKEGLLKRFAYALFYRFLRKVSVIEIPLDSGDFCLMDKSVVNAVRSLPERMRFVRGLRSWVGFRQVGVPYERDYRFAGTSKYSFRMLLGFAYDGIFSHTTAPLRVSVYIGFIIALFAIVGGMFVIYEKLSHDIPIAGWSSTIVVITFLGGISLFTLGVIGEYISRIYEEVKQRPLYIVRERLGL
jgi:dolichol-phosphate mannosyltransferase